MPEGSVKDHCEEARIVQSVPHRTLCPKSWAMLGMLYQPLDYKHGQDKK